ncbi:MAG TPA: hypothetical protein VK824_04510 [Planctomycetota bacterium]|nr:hypothetical protein [Planctomycetota bacterium]
MTVCGALLLAAGTLALAGVPREAGERMRGGWAVGPLAAGPAHLSTAVSPAPAPVPAVAPSLVRVAWPVVTARLAARTAAGVDDGAKESVRAALAEAAAGKREALKLSGAEREQALLDVTARYAAIAEDPGNAAAGRAEAAFRAADLLRAARHLDEAAVMYARATELGAEAEGGAEFAARGLLECAHLKRRAHDVAGALTLYAAVRERFPDEKRSAAHAVTWLGKLQLQSDQHEQGMATLLGFRERFPEYPTEAVRNADLVALDQLDAGDEAGARRTVEQIQQAMKELVEQGGKQGEAVGKALAAMRVTEQLASY